ncbi:MAG: hypothetical protein B7C24_01615 [Bacteroidetes bacterium 4572_77]|nr:MAG: hypothetical protein B7C24_01615 [Bacteroidetes bacterium 4572_77]
MYNPLPYLPEKFQKIIQTLKKKEVHSKIIFFTLGLLSTLWFLFRVIPKPSRAAYPCMQATAPYMAGFVLWLSSLFSSAFFLVKFRRSLHTHKYLYAALFFLLFASGIFINASLFPNKYIFANTSNYQKAEWNNTQRMIGLKGNMTTNFDEVAIVKSTEENASDLLFNEIEAMVREAVEMAGGIHGVINNGDYVVLKPNLVTLPPTPTPDYVEVSGMATDWRVVKAVAKMVREINPDGKIYIIESSAATTTWETFNYYNYSLENIPEVDLIVALEDTCGAYENYNDPLLDKIFLEDTIRLYPDEEKPNLSPEFYIAKIYNDADVVISIPVLKNHQDAVITGGVKNVAIGMAPTSIYGMSETLFGKWTKIDHSWENLNKWLHDFYLCKPVDFVVVDGLQGFDHGPVGVDELTMEEMQHNMRLIIAGKQALSVDAVCGNIMSLDPSFANYMVYLDKEEYEVGTIDARFIRINGVKIPEVREVFPHITEVATNAIYNDYTPPAIEVSFPIIQDHTIAFNLQSDEDLNKVELEVNGVLLDQVCIADFASITFEVEDELLPIKDVKLIGYDKFYNQTEKTFENLGYNELEMPAKLKQNFPNPFSETTNISFTLEKPNLVRLYITDAQGKTLETLIDAKLKTGNHQYQWGSNIQSGIYFLSLEIEGAQITKKMIKQ